MRSFTTSILIAIVVLAVAGGAYYFIFMSGPQVDLTAPITSEAYVPKIEVSAMSNPVFQALKNYSVLPITVDAVGNSLPFSEKIFIEPATTTPDTLEF